MLPANAETAVLHCTPFISLHTDARDIPCFLATCVSDMPERRSWITCSRFTSSRALPICLPSARARAIPLLTLSISSARSISPSTATIPRNASCSNKRCIALRHAYLRPRVEQPGTYRKIADRVHRLKVGQHFDVRGVGTDERSRNRFRSGLYAAARLDRVSVRSQPDGSVRVTKVGEWSGVEA